MRRTSRWASVLAAILLIPTVQAQDEPNSRTIVVTGKRQASEAQARHFVRQVVATNTGQLARFLDPVCPHILGVPPSLASEMEDRIRSDAADARVPLAPAGCKPNLVGVIAKNADVFIAFMRKHHGSFFDDLSDVDLHDAFKSGAVHSWRLIETRDADGAPASGDPAVAEAHTSSGDPPMVEAYGSSAFAAPTQAATVNAVVVLDKKIVLDKTVAQLADYIAMRALAGARPPKADGAVPPTILSLFDASAVAPREMTSMDAGLLAGLYASATTVDAPSQVFDISRQMVRVRRPPRK